MMDFFSRLNELGSDVYARYPRINCGGCCVFASLVGARLERLGIATRIAVGDDEIELGTNIDEIRPKIDNKLRNWNREGVHFGHVVVEFDYDGATYHYDTAGVIPAQDHTKTINYQIFDGRLTVKEASELAAEERWNWMFNRACIPDLTRMVNDFFDMIEFEAIGYAA